MTRKSRSVPDFIQKMDWLVIISILFLVGFLGSLTYKHYFTQQQQLRMQKLAALQATELALVEGVDITEELLERADLDGDGQVNQADVDIMKESFLNIDNQSLKADLNQDGRIDTNDYALLVTIITKLEKANDGR